MRTIRIIVLCIFAISVKFNIYAGDLSEEAKYISKNTVPISRIDSYFFQSNDINKMYVAKSLLKYKDKEAVILYKKLLDDSRIEFQNYSILPLINSGEFDLAFTKFKELLLNNEIINPFNLYHSGDHSKFSAQKLILFNKYKSEFVPFLKEACSLDSVSYHIKFRVSDLLYSLGEEEEIKIVCEEILEKVPESSNQSSENSEVDSKNSSLRYYAYQKLKELKKKSD